MKLAHVIAAVLTVTVLTAVASPARAANVGFEEVQIANGDEAPLTVGIWYPTDAPASAHRLGDFTQAVATGAPLAADAERGLPLVVMSHGGGGWYDSHYDTAWSLAQAGFVAAALSHNGDTFKDQSQVMKVWRRPQQLHRLIDYMLQTWPQHAHLDAARVGAFGFSNGGFTVLVAAGGVPDLAAIGPYCAAHADHDLCSALQHAGVDPGTVADAPASVWVHDLRIKAIVVAAPAFGFAFDRAGLSGVHVPVQLWGAADDRHQPPPFYEDAVRANLPTPPEYHVIEHAGHFDFLPPCGPQTMKLAPGICTSEAGFDRAAFHERFNAEVVRFFKAALP
ncbi:dienelactone hydrolase family protein [Paraburkholderia sp. DHOC27]|uniref:alpha/beta hydrolase family protein n=1 Tax=Paraburkholderia sp. DHOC27 TaxID=2303330 RepID=UPI000E3C6137|nr:dienelactone hydrolase family protein [Paraburkholderia sp. DHOC27]RFU48978.1 dienelactone hydrolase [Paraburkholderia sp. DHOC27]